MVTNDIKMLNSDRENNDLLLKTQNGRIWNFRPWIYTPPLKGSHLWKIRIRLLGWWVSGSLGCHITSSFLYGKQGPKNQVQLSTRALNE